MNFQARHVIKGCIIRDERFAIIAGDLGYPIVILAQLESFSHQLPVNAGGFKSRFRQKANQRKA